MLLNEIQVTDGLTELLSSKGPMFHDVHANRQPIVIPAGEQTADIGTSLIEFLSSYLPSRHAVLFGAAVGSVPGRLTGAGYTVHVLNSTPENAQQPLSVREAGERPCEIGLLAAGSQDMALLAMRAIGRNSAVTMVECEPFEAAFEQFAQEMRRRGYDWHIVLYRTDDRASASYYCNQVRCVAGRAAKAVFFQDRAVFAHALRWCEAVLPPTYFQ